MTTKPPKAAIAKWVRALRSGEYAQTKQALQDQFGYCCLGVACELFISKPMLKFDGVALFGGHPADQPKVPTWLKDVNDDVAELTGLALSNLNDYQDLTFDEIADVLQLVYLEGALND